MKINKLAAGALALALTLGSQTAAHAAYSVTVDGTGWSISDQSSFGLSSVGTNGNWPHGAYGIDYARLKVQVASTGTYDTFRCLTSSPITEADSDFVIDCSSGDTDAVAGLSWTGSAKIFAGPYQGLVARLQYTVTNTSGSSKTLDFKYEIDDEECNTGVNGAGNLSTSNGTTLAMTSDYWLTCGNNDQASETTAWGNTFASTMTVTGTSSDSGYWAFNNENVTLAAGESKNYVFFYYSVGSTTRGNELGLTDAETIAKADEFFNLCNLGDSRLWEGITSADNWDFSQAINCASDENSGSEGLANTGADSSALTGLVATSIVALTAAVAIRRRSIRN
ncbi:MAG: hypothetical protein K9G02_01900 [Microbacteriaceae bacterium]|nr:hypothetical protein [Microbacteriaceae bacterium]